MQVKEEEEGDDEDSDDDEEEEEEDESKPPAKVHLTPLELEGLCNLLGKLETLPSNKKCVPAGIHNAPALMTSIKVHTRGPGQVTWKPGNSHGRMSRTP